MINTTQNQLFICIENMIIDSNIGYTLDQIILGLTSNENSGSNNEFVLMQEVYKKPISVIPNNYLISDNKKVSNLLYERIVQLDFYGETSADKANNFVVWLTSIAPYYLVDNYPNISVGQIKDIGNASLEYNAGKYVDKYSIRITIYTQQSIETTVNTTSTFNIQHKLIKRK